MRQHTAKHQKYCTASVHVVTSLVGVQAEGGGGRGVRLMLEPRLPAAVGHPVEQTCLLYMKDILPTGGC